MRTKQPCVHPAFSELGLYVGFDSQDIATFKDRWRFKIREFYKSSDQLVALGDTRHADGFYGIEMEKQTLNLLRNEYHCQRFENVINSDHFPKQSIFYYDYLEILGCSLCLAGQAERALDVLEEAVAADKAGFEAYFYLVTMLASAGDFERLENISRVFLEKFPNEPRAIAHVDGVWKSLGRKPRTKA